MVNRVILIGHLGQDPEVRRLENGAMVAKLRLATNESYKDRSGEWQTLTEWHDVVTWRAQAERAESQLTKGAHVYIEGKLTHRSWQDKDGNNRRTTEVVSNYFRRLDKRDQAGGIGGMGASFPSAQDEAPAYSDAPAAPKPAAPANDAPPPADDDLPF